MKRSGGLDAQRRRGDARRPEKSGERPRRQAGRHRARRRPPRTARDLRRWQKGPWVGRRRRGHSLMPLSSGPSSSLSSLSFSRLDLRTDISTHR